MRQYLQVARPITIRSIIGLLLLTACARGPTGVVVRDGTRFSSDAHVHGDSLVVTLTATNTVAVEISFGIGGGCPMLVRLFADARQSASPVWDEGQWRTCVLSLRELNLLPRQSVTFQDVIPNAVLREANVRGRVYVSTIAQLEPPLPLNAGYVSLPPPSR